MYDKELKELKKYLKPSSAIIVVGVIFEVLAIIALLAIGSVGDEDKTYALIFGVIFLVMGIVMICSGFSTTRAMNKTIAKIESGGGMQALINDFSSGSKAFNDCLIVGRTFLIGKRTGTIITYPDIVQIYQFVQKNNHVETLRTLKVVTSDKKEHNLCNIPLRGKGDEEVNRLLNYILSVNPNVKVGY